MNESSFASVFELCARDVWRLSLSKESAAVPRNAAALAFAYLRYGEFRITFLFSLAIFFLLCSDFLRTTERSSLSDDPTLVQFLV